MTGFDVRELRVVRFEERSAREEYLNIDDVELESDLLDVGNLKVQLSHRTLGNIKA
jgi:hypothetical protein